MQTAEYELSFTDCWPGTGMACTTPGPTRQQPATLEVSLAKTSEKQTNPDNRCWRAVAALLAHSEFSIIL